MEDIEISAQLLADFELFIKFFYKLRTGREFVMPHSPGRECYLTTIFRALNTVSRLDSQRLLINIPPGYGKTETIMHWIAFMMAHYPDSKFIYCSYSKQLAVLHTGIIRQIMSLPHYRHLFSVGIKRDSNAKEFFETSQGGSVYGVGIAGTITGMGAGLQNCDRFSGGIIVDDAHKPNEVTSDTIRYRDLNWFKDTLISRLRGANVPIVFIGQQLHEDDLPNNLIKSYDGMDWDKIIIPVLDEHNNPLNPEFQSLEYLLKFKESAPYTFSAQYMQSPTPAGGSLFKSTWLRQEKFEPKLLTTFITVDTAETSKTYNDATVFSFWGLYKMRDPEVDVELDLYGLHWIDCHECWVEPKDLRPEFLSFYASCMRHPVKPYCAAIEKKSTGSTLCSVLKEMPGIYIMEIERSGASGSKTQRFLDVQPYVARKQVSIDPYARHYTHVCDHLNKITANDSHRYDDIADTMADAIRLALIDKVIRIEDNKAVSRNPVLQKVLNRNRSISKLRSLI